MRLDIKHDEVVVIENEVDIKHDAAQSEMKSVFICKTCACQDALHASSSALKRQRRTGFLICLTLTSPSGLSCLLR